MDDIVFRGFRSGDVEAMYALDVACFEKPFRFSRAMVRQSAEAANARVVIAELAGALIGFAVVHIEPVRIDRRANAKAGYVVTLDVDPAARRHGIARLMMQQLEQDARKAGCIAMLLHVYTGNEGAIRFYERQGFTRTSTVRNFYAQGFDAWVYRKEISRTAR
jgi:ribosomal-protein-alanine N-acetyltransferase